MSGLNGNSRTSTNCADTVKHDSKRRKLCFSEKSTLRFIESTDQIYADKGAFVSDAHNMHMLLSVEDRKNKELSKDNDHLVCHLDSSSSHTKEANIEAVVKTKEEDGPSLATQVIQNLILSLAKNRSITTDQIMNLLESVSSRRLAAAPHRIEPTSSTEAEKSLGTAAEKSSSAEAEKQSSNQMLCSEVIYRLQLIGARIEARGKASLLPCTSKIGREFLPAIHFLISTTAQSASRSTPIAVM